MNNLKSMYCNLLSEGADSNVFTVEYNHRAFACILIIQDYGSSLLLSTLGENPMTIAVDIQRDFSAPLHLDNEEYLVLARYLGFTGVTGNVFKPSRFFEEFDNHIDPSFNRSATLRERTRAVGRAVNIADGDKIYFCGWRRNGDAGHVTSKNYAKTKKLMGEDIANHLLKANISSCWTNVPDDENLALLNQYLNHLN